MVRSFLYCIDNVSLIADYAMPVETFIVGDERARFLYRGSNEYGNICGIKTHFACAVALVFATDKDKSSGTFLFASLFGSSF